MIALGHKKASAALAGEIELATAGAVKRAALRPDLFGELSRGGPDHEAAA